MSITSGIIQRKRTHRHIRISVKGALYDVRVLWAWPFDFLMCFWSSPSFGIRWLVFMLFQLRTMLTRLMTMLTCSYHSEKKWRVREEDEEENVLWFYPRCSRVTRTVHECSVEPVNIIPPTVVTYYIYG